MKILVTGGAGFIASHITDLYIQAGHKVVVVDDLSSGKKENINSKAEFYKLDITSPEIEELFKKYQFDFLNHHAAQIDIRKSVENPILDAEINILGTIKLLEYCQRYSVKKIIYPSTGGAIYGEPKYLPADELHPVRPLAPYGISKHCSEHYIEYFSDIYNIDYIILRYANVYGPRQDPLGEAGVVAIFAGKLLSSEPAIIFGNGEQSRDFVYVSDIAEANLLALALGSKEIINLSFGEPTTVNQILKKMTKLIKSDIKPVYKEPRKGEVYQIYLGNQKAKKILGWKPKVTLEKGLQKTIDFFRGQPETV